MCFININKSTSSPVFRDRCSFLCCLTNKGNEKPAKYFAAFLLKSLFKIFFITAGKADNIRILNSFNPAGKIAKRLLKNGPG
jgi:hypothetical protein